MVLLYRALAPAFQNPERREVSALFMLAALAIPLFYLPAFFFGSTTNFTVVTPGASGSSTSGWKAFSSSS